MKIRTCLVILSLAIAAGASAQIRSYHIGVTAGIDYSSLQSDLFTTSSGRPAPVIGCSFVVGLGDLIELNQEIALTFKGAKARAVYFRPEDRPEEHTYNYYYNTFETGLFAGLQPSRSIPLRIQAGGFFGANFHTLDRSQRELMIVDYDNINNAVRAVDLNDGFAGIDYGPAVGISAGEGRFRANARYYMGLRNLYDQIDFVQTGPHIRTNAIRLTLTYFLQ